MVRTKRSQPVAAEPATRVSSRKRSRQDMDEPIETTPTKKRIPSRNTATSLKQPVDHDTISAYDVPTSDQEDENFTTAPNTPSAKGNTGKRKRVDDTPSKGTPTKDVLKEVTTPSSRRGKGKTVETPSRAKKSTNAETPAWRRNDRSARKKSARALIEQVVDGVSDDEVDQGITREIYDSSDEDENELSAEEAGRLDESEAPPLDSTPSKRPRGRPKSAKTKAKEARKRSPTPPRDLPPHELYFAQNRPGGAKTSDNTLASLQLLTHEEYFSVLHDYQDRHVEDIEFLQSIHVESFPQWIFEMSQGFTICLYGYGSKRPLLHNFAKHLYQSYTDHAINKIIVINGYVRTTSIREVLSTVAGAVSPSHKVPTGNPSAMLDSVKGLLAAHDDMTLTIILNSIDAATLRKAGFQSVLAQLAALPSIRLICSADTPDFALLWDSGLRSSFNFVFHDCTTFAPYTAEMDVVDDVHELLGRKARRVGGKEGVTYVLRSLPENAKNLFRLLVGEVLVTMEDEDMSSGENPGVEYRMLYNKAVEEFICSSEMAFRTLLKEFHDHQMITSSKDVLGAELLSVPFRKEELEGILEDLMA